MIKLPPSLAAAISTLKILFAKSRRGFVNTLYIRMSQSKNCGKDERAEKKVLTGNACDR